MLIDPSKFQMTYAFTSDRLGFRNWRDEDLNPMAAINANPKVTEYFPSNQDERQTPDFIGRMKDQWVRMGFCYFAVEELESKAFIGFIGLSEQHYEAFFNPSVDIGWRLDPRYWGKGYATEGAKRCLEYAFEVVELQQVVSVCPEINSNSERVMQKIGMSEVAVFDHPLLASSPVLTRCLLYRMNNPRHA